MREYVIPCPGPGGCEDLTFCVCQEMRAQREQIARLREALEQCRGYLNDRWVGSEEMRLLGVVKTALGEK